MTCAPCSVSSDFIVGNVRRVLAGSRLGQGGTAHTGGFISVCHTAQSTLTQLSAPPLSGAPSPPAVTSLPRSGAFQLGTEPGWSPPVFGPGGRKGRKMQRGGFCERREHNVSVDGGRRGCDPYLPVTLPAVIAQPCTPPRTNPRLSPV